MLVRERYHNAAKAGKKVILDELCAVSRYNRKYAIRALNQHLKPKLPKKGRPRTYTDSLLPHIRCLWRMTGYIGAKRLCASFRLWLKHYKASALGQTLSQRDFYRIKHMSPATVGRMIARIRGETHGLSTTRVDYLLKSQIPIGILDYKVTKPGCMQADTVAHCGNAIFGEYAHTLSMTDVASFWTENRAIWTKDSQQVCDQMQSIERSLPFDLHTLSTDNGTEFLNYRVLSYVRTRRKPIHLMRSRPYQKDDQAYVEQKNWTHVRLLFGYDRIENPGLISMMNDIYENYWNPLQNYFLPSMKIMSKQRVGGKTRKKYDHPKTPCERLLSSSHISNHQKKKLREKLKSLNPFELRFELDKKMKEFSKLLKTSKSKQEAA